jgi:hypothetical protein
MGLLDDAIREHLELKRRTGAEPGEIARVEREALEPTGEELQAVFDGHAAAHAEDDVHGHLEYAPEQGSVDLADHEHASGPMRGVPEAAHDVEFAHPPEHEHGVGYEHPPEHEHDVDYAHPPAAGPHVDVAPRHDVEHGADASTVGQETVELDMQAVLEEDDDAARAGSSPAAEPMSGAGTNRPALYSHQEEPLDWET